MKQNIPILIGILACIAAIFLSVNCAGTQPDTTLPIPYAVVSFPIAAAFMLASYRYIRKHSND